MPVSRRVQFDYGYDLAIFTHSRSGEVEPGLAFVQVKATDRLPLRKDGKTISWTASRRDLKLWLNETYPVILVVYDGIKDRAHWLDVQTYFSDRSTSELFFAGATINVSIPARSRINRRSIEAIAQHKRNVHLELRGKETRK